MSITSFSAYDAISSKPVSAWKYCLLTL